MATITSTRILREMLENDGVYPGDPQALSICKYLNTETKKWSYSVCYTPTCVSNLVNSPFVGEIILLWNNHIGLTPWGKQELEKLRKEQPK